MGRTPPPYCFCKDLIRWGLAGGGLLRMCGERSYTFECLKVGRLRTHGPPYTPGICKDVKGKGL